MQAYDNISVEEVRNNLIDFIRQIAPIAESHGVFLAIHPDDPPIGLLGLPRIVSTASDVQKLLGDYMTFKFKNRFITIHFRVIYQDYIILMSISSTLVSVWYLTTIFCTRA